MKPHPPKYALEFLRWFCREDYLEEVEGDLMELYDKYYKQSPARAKWKFTWNVILYFRPEFIKSFNRDQYISPTAMFRHNFLLTYRTFKRYKTSFFINLVGLSCGIACALLIYLWVNHELHVDKFHEKDAWLYQVMENWEADGGIRTEFATSGPMAEALIEEMPEVEYSTAVAPSSWYGFSRLSLSVGEKNIKAAGQYVGKDYFNIFSYPLIYGNKNEVLSDKNSIVISEKLAMKLFNTIEGIIGKVVAFQHEQEFMVSGVFKGIPHYSSTQFDFVLSFEILKETRPWVTSWGSAGPLVYLVLKEGTDIQQFNDKLRGFIKKVKHDENNSRMPFLQRYSHHYLHGTYENGVQTGGRIEYVRLFSFIAISILLIACINFMNLSTARASRRLKEIGIKKVVGAGRKTLIFQYMGESILMAFFSLILAMLVVILFLPHFNQITGKELTFGLEQKLIVSALLIAFCSGVIAGSYPALYLSGFKPLGILKGKLNASVWEFWTRQGLVVFQFTISIILIVSVWVVHRQIEFVQRQSFGYDRENVIWFDIEGRLKANTDTFLSEAKKIPGVINAAATSHSMIKHNWSMQGMEWEGRSPDDKTTFQIAGVGYDFIEMIGVEIKEGRSFSRDFGAESEKIIFNEAAIEAMGLKNPIGSTVNLFMGKKEIIGVAKNFHFESFHEELKPLFFVLLPHGINKIMVKIEAGKEKETLEGLRNFYETYNQGFIFDYRFLDDDYQALYVVEQRVSTLAEYFTGIAILISCLGLFGLAAFTTERRLKEIGIRKILGSSEFRIVHLLSGDFTKMVLLAILIALPLSYFIATWWLESFAYRIGLKWWFFMGAGSIALLIAWFTVGLQTVKAARINPTDCLKDE